MEFTLKTKINATAEEIYSTWMSSESHTKRQTEKLFQRGTVILKWKTMN